MNTYSCIALVIALLATVLQVQAQAPSGGAATLTIQFDNTKKSVMKPVREKLPAVNITHLSSQSNQTSQ
jgi:hypothetical protein